MLVLTRSKGETICIADGTIRVTVTEVRGGRVKLRIEAPKEMPIRRSEVDPDAKGGSCEAV